MAIVDLIIIAVVVAAAVWGYRQGLSTDAFALAGFAVGAIIGSRVAPSILDGGREDPFAPAVSLPAALLLGALLAAAFERLGRELRIRIRRRSVIDVAGGALIALGVGIVAVWIVGVAAAQFDDLKDTVRDSEVIEEINAAIPPPGPLLNPGERRKDPLPMLAGPDPNVGPADPSIRRDAQVRTAARSVVKIFTSSCERPGAGTGWVGGDGLVLTNAHIVKGSKTGEVTGKVRGRGPSHKADTVYFDELNDVAVLRMSGISTVPALRLAPRDRAGIYVAAMGFPEAGPFRITPGRMGVTVRRPEEDRSITVMRSAGTSPGSSGSPVVDSTGRVVTMHWGSRSDDRVQYGVPVRFLRRALRRAGGRADTGSCVGG